MIDQSDFRLATARGNAIAWARRVMADPTTLFLDTETTGLGPDAEICDLAIVDREGGVVLDTLVRPERPIPAEATAVHGITDADVAGALPWSEVYWIVRMVLAGKRVVIYNADYDTGVLHTRSLACDLTPLAFPFSCAMRAFADFAGAPGRYPGQHRWHKLGEACALVGIDPGHSHRALADALACRDLVAAMAAADEPRRQVDSEAALDQPT